MVFRFDQVVRTERVVLSYKDLEHFSLPPFVKMVLKTVQWNVNIIYYFNCCCCCCCCCLWWYLLLGLLVLRPSISSLLQSATTVATRCDSSFYYKVYWSVITKCDSVFYYKDRQVLLQSATILLSVIGITNQKSATEQSIAKNIEKYRSSYWLKRAGSWRCDFFTLACLCVACSRMTLCVRNIHFLICQKDYYIISLSFPFCSKPIKKLHKTYWNWAIFYVIRQYT